jgi:hypothetical protein
VVVGVLARRLTAQHAHRITGKDAGAEPLLMLKVVALGYR